MARTSRKSRRHLRAQSLFDVVSVSSISCRFWYLDAIRLKINSRSR